MSADPNLAADFINGDISFWVRAEGRPPQRQPLPGPIDADVAIVGAGMTGLWSAYYLKQARPELDIVVIEKEFAGFGASGRNGGWMSAKSPGQFRRYAKAGGVDAAVALEREMFASVREAVDVAKQEGFGDHVVRDGLIHVATSEAQLSRLRAETAKLEDHGWKRDEDFVVLSPSELHQRVHVNRAKGAYWSPHCARINPAQFTFGLAETVERMGVRIYEGTTATAVAPRAVHTDRGRVSAKFVVQALEGYTCTLEGQRRRLLPMNSSMVVTERLTDEQFASVAWHGAELMGDVAHNFAYIQRTADNRIALGGRGVPYNFGSSFDRRGRTADAAVRQLGARLVELFPGLRDVKLEQSWSGVLGVPRDWCAGVEFDPASGVASAGGYVGHGVTGTNLAGRTVRDLILGESTELTRLPWVGHRARNWEFEPLRWLAARALYAVYRFADREEYRTGAPRTHVSAKMANLISGRCPAGGAPPRGCRAPIPPAPSGRAMRGHRTAARRASLLGYTFAKLLRYRFGVKPL
ncbi:FAD-dependent oxidoreductase [Leucobacter sp. CSA1]|uniref:FAD-dependent oxidoreductase n=1 Tax=Leucobacter chromiisoli TaxID=2796471 RepID=A0A934Q359_9MICO|nr:FAD-binding oxidoreductase [Leucobacter chromiisoli]MBK0417554.1 FAD-dependent oxidoreductase [Leucobacter chromiisoli]